MMTRIKSTRFAYVEHPIMERLIILSLAVPLHLLATPWLFMTKRDYRVYLDHMPILWGQASLLSACLFFYC